jgi:hypothetical protein
MTALNQIIPKNAKETVGKKLEVKVPVMQEALTPEVAGMADLQHAVADPRAERPSDVLVSPQTYGNRAVQRMLAKHDNIQAKLTSGAANDADAVVVRGYWLRCSTGL